MKKLLAIFFLFTFINGYTAFGEVLKLPILVHHFIEHTQEDKAVRIFDFLVQHYANKINHQHQNNQSEHEKLPFKTINSHPSSAVSIVSSFFFVISHNNAVIVDLQKPAYNEQDYPNTFLSSIWQPPCFS